MKKLILLLVFIITFSTVIGGFPSTDINNWWMNWYNPENTNTMHYSPTYDMNFENSAINFTSVSSTDYNIVTGDLDNDGSIESVMVSGNTLIIRDSNWGVVDSVSIGDNNYVTILPQDCNALGYGTVAPNTIMTVSHSDDTVRSYCFNGTDTNLVDSYQLDLRTEDDQLTCQNSSYSGLYQCFIATNTGYAVCGVSTSVIDCYNYTQTNIGNFFAEHKPAVNDLRGGSDLEAVFYCNDSTGGFAIVDELGNTDYENCTNALLIANTMSNDELQEPLIIPDTDYIILRHSGTPSTRYARYRGFDEDGNFLYTLQPAQSDIGTDFSKITNAVLRDKDDSGTEDQICYGWCASNPAIACYDIYSGNYDASYSHYDNLPWNCWGHSELLAIELDSSALGEELLIWENHSTNEWHVLTYNSSRASNDKWESYVVNSSTGFPKRIIVTNIYDNSPPHLLMYDSSNVYYFTGSTGAVTQEYAPYINFFDIQPNENVTATNNSFIINVTAQDDNNDIIDICIDASYQPEHESGYNVQTSPHLSCVQNSSNLTTTFTLNSLVGKIGTHYKVYTSDSTFYAFDEVDSYEDNVVWDNATPIHWFCIYANERGTSTGIERIKISITDYDYNGTHTVWKITESDGKFWLRLPEGNYSVLAEDVRDTAPHYENKTKSNLHTYNNSLICTHYLEMDRVETEEIDLSFVVRDSVYYSPIENVNVTLITPPTPQSQYTNPSGQAYFSNLNQSVFYVKFEKEDYYTNLHYYSARTEPHVVYLINRNETPVEIRIEVLDSQTFSAVGQAFVEMTNPITFETYYSFTGETDGLVTQPIYGYGYTWNIYITKDGYQDKDTSIYVSGVQIQDFQIYIDPTGINVTDYVTDRGCQDMLSGIWLCNVNNISCTNNSQCPSDMCSALGYCSSFNYSWCDATNRPRNQRCVISATFGGAMSWIADWMLDNFFWLLVIIIMVLFGATFFVFLRSRTRK